MTSLTESSGVKAPAGKARAASDPSGGRASQQAVAKESELLAAKRRPHWLRTRLGLMRMANHLYGDEGYSAGEGTGYKQPAGSPWS